MEFRIASADASFNASDEELSELLTQVYVNGGFTDSAEAASLFEPSTVRRRGQLIVARTSADSEFAGMVILVPSDSPACKLAQPGEGDVHLLGVMPKYRRRGLGNQLVLAVIQFAKQNNYRKLILWTQTAMLAAQKIYESSGFVHVSDLTRNGRTFRVYEKLLREMNP